MRTKRYQYSFTQYHYFPLRKKSGAGFTILELLISVAILLAMATVSVVAFQNFSESAALRLATQDVSVALLDARNSTLASADDTVYGVHFGSTTITTFQGGVYSSSSPSNDALTFEREVVASPSLSGGGDAIVFQRLTGEVSATGTILLTEVRSGKTATITVHASGLIEN